MGEIFYFGIFLDIYLDLVIIRKFEKLYWEINY